MILLPADLPPLLPRGNPAGLPGADARRAFSIDAEIAAAREHLHRSIGQRARWAMVAIRERAEIERIKLWASMEEMR